MTKRIDFKKYSDFVDAVTSDESRDFIALSDRLVALDEQGANIERLMTGAIGINAEGGEINYYFIYGPELMSVAQQYTKITGCPDLPPLWSLPHFLSQLPITLSHDCGQL